MSEAPDPRETDPVVARRARAAALAAVGTRAGYGFLTIAVAAFLWGWATRFSTTITAVFATAMALCTVTLAPSIVLGYAVRAAERADRAAGR